MEKDSQAQESESNEGVGSGEGIEAGAGNAMPLVTIELTLYCQVVPHEVSGELVPELRMAGGGDPLKGLNTAKAKLQMQLGKKKRAGIHKNISGPFSQSMSNLDDNG